MAATSPRETDCRHDFVQPSYGAKFVCRHCGGETVQYREGRRYKAFRDKTGGRWRSSRDKRIRARLRG